GGGLVLDLFDEAIRTQQHVGQALLAQQRHGLGLCRQRGRENRRHVAGERRFRISAGLAGLAGGLVRLQCSRDPGEQRLGGRLQCNERLVVLLLLRHEAVNLVAQPGELAAPHVGRNGGLVTGGAAPGWPVGAGWPDYVLHDEALRIAFQAPLQRGRGGLALGRREGSVVDDHSDEVAPRVHYAGPGGGVGLRGGGGEDVGGPQGEHDQIGGRELVHRTAGEPGDIARDGGDVARRGRGRRTCGPYGQRRAQPVGDDRRRVAEHAHRGRAAVGRRRRGHRGRRGRIAVETALPCDDVVTQHSE
ncbi:hypothetical protein CAUPRSCDRAFT_12166, partial [Caulochytrium protostelioides]